MIVFRRQVPAVGRQLVARNRAVLAVDRAAKTLYRVNQFVVSIQIKLALAELIWNRELRRRQQYKPLVKRRNGAVE